MGARALAFFAYSLCVYNSGCATLLYNESPSQFRAMIVSVVWIADAIAVAIGMPITHWVDRVEYKVRHGEENRFTSQEFGMYLFLVCIGLASVVLIAHLVLIRCWRRPN